MYFQGVVYYTTGPYLAGCNVLLYRRPVGSYFALTFTLTLTPLPRTVPITNIMVSYGF